MLYVCILFILHSILFPFILVLSSYEHYYYYCYYYFIMTASVV
jgi:hypothetical protein